jgi:type IV fimbrial biogenesis protein FimT
VRERGFTLLELLATLSIMALLLAVGLPSLSQQIDNNRTRTAAFDLMSAVQLARNTAVTTNQRVTLQHLGSWQDGWEVYVDENHNAQREPEERLVLRNESATPPARVSGNTPVQNYISFIGSGESRRASGNPQGAFLAGTLTVCPTNSGRGYQLVLSRGGRMRMMRIDQTECDGI